MKPCAFGTSCLAGILLAVPVPPVLGAPARANDNPTEPGRFVFLTSITVTGKDAEAQLYDRADNTRTRVRLAGADTFAITDAEGRVTGRGRAVRLAEREMVFQAGGKYYAVRVGQTLAEALREPLGTERIEALKLPPPR
jgi:hypothetical protein